MTSTSTDYRGRKWFIASSRAFFSSATSRDLEHDDIIKSRSKSLVRTTKSRSPLSELHMVLPTTTTVKMLVKIGAPERPRPWCCYISYPALHSYLAIKLRDCMCETKAFNVLFSFFFFLSKRLLSLKPTFLWLVDDESCWGLISKNQLVRIAGKGNI